MSDLLEIITCPQWGARKPKNPLTSTRFGGRIIFHHTASHHAEISLPSNESRAEAIQYARDIQAYHMDHNGWDDSGHNFLVCRNGDVLQGRWLTVSQIEAGHMVVSAHCPGYNNCVGIEHEHRGNEEPTPYQLDASARLMAWLAIQYGRKTTLPVDPHSAHFATACPGRLKAYIPAIIRNAARYLDTAL